MPRSIEDTFIVLGPAIAGALLFLVPLFANKGERAPSRRPWSIALVVLVVLMICTLWYQGAKSPWSPNFEAQPLTAEVVGSTSGPVFTGAKLFHDKGCLNCHLIGRAGGRRGPDLTVVGDRLSADQLILRIANGGVNMPAFAQNLTPAEMNDLVAFLRSRQAAAARR